MTNLEERADAPIGIAGTRPERRDAAEHRERILASARTLFAEQGVDAVSMHQIAQAAGVGQGTLYRRYAHKGQLCFDLLRESGVAFWSEIEAYLDSTEGVVSPLDRLDRVIELLLEFIESKSHLLSAIDDCFSAGRREEQFQNPFRVWIHDRVAGLLRDAMVSGRLPDLDVDFTTDALLAMISVDLYLHQRRERGFSPQRILDGVRQMYRSREVIPTPRPQ